MHVLACLKLKDFRHAKYAILSITHYITVNFFIANNG